MSLKPAQLDELIRIERLPESIQDAIREIYRPVAKKLADTFNPNREIVALVGLNGCQGSGKSTMARFLQQILHAEFGLNVAVLSIDDFYLPRSQRSKLARTVHPLLETRGVPGTHDLDMLNTTIDCLRNAATSSQTRIPRFSKAIDDCEARSEWGTHDGRPDIILLEGWCVGATAQPAKELRSARNAWEADNDPDCVWREYVNDQLAGDYASLFMRLDWLIMLCAPSVDVVFTWRQQQERKLQEQQSSDRDVGMGDTELREFLMHYERLTVDMLDNMPERANTVIHLRANRRLDRLSYR